MIRPLLHYGHPDLRKKAAEVSQLTAEVEQFIRDLVETMQSHNCIGFAAPQVGVLWRVIVTTVAGEDASGAVLYYPEPQVFINPELSEPSEETVVAEEGNPVLPGVRAQVERPRAITLKGLTLQGEIVEMRLSGMAARVAMHENDHLNGILFIDRALPSEKKRLDPLLKQLKRKL